MAQVKVGRDRKPRPTLIVSMGLLGKKPGEPDDDDAAPAAAADKGNGAPDNKIGAPASDDNSDWKPGDGPPPPGASNFTDQTKACSVCSYFDPAGYNGVGECKMGVPEADFSKSDPDASTCKFFEANEEMGETPAQEAAEDESTEGAPGAKS